MFVVSILRLARPGTLIGLITYDSFLTAKSHKKLRLEILDKCRIHYLILCPQALFHSQGADVRTCIMIIEIGKEEQGVIHTSNRPVSLQDFESILLEERFQPLSIPELVLTGSSDNQEFVIGCPSEVKGLFSQRRLGDVFPCLTGISTGNDNMYITKEPDEDHTVPFFKNPATRRFFTEPDGYLTNDFLEVSRRVRNFMVRNKTYIGRERSCWSDGTKKTPETIKRDGNVEPQNDSWCPPQSTTSQKITGKVN